MTSPKSKPDDFASECSKIEEFHSIKTDKGTEKLESHFTHFTEIFVYACQIHSHAQTYSMKKNMFAPYWENEV